MQSSERYDSLIAFYSQKYQRNPKQTKRQIRRESNFDPDARSRAGAVGLAQFMPATWAEWRDGTAGIQPPPNDLRLVDPRDPEDAIAAMCAYMAALEKACATFVPDDMAVRQWTLAPALACYNYGIGHVRALFRNADMAGWRHELPEETLQYLVYCLAYDFETLTVTGG